MADSTSQNPQKVVEKYKYSNMINRTTSESIRLSDSDKILNHPTSLSAPKKKTSFQITSVTVGGHTSNDGGDDSADDLDESHAEDISDVIDTSRATDIENETPSYSEDTFSKDDVFFNSSTSLGTAPVIPTSSQYGLAIVSTPEGCSNILNANVSGGNNAAGNDLHVNVSDNVINLGIVGSKHLEGDMRDLHTHTGRNERFKVVKIESTEPFKRGRWMCMDYLDHTMLQQQQQQQQQQHQLQSQGSVVNSNAAKVESSDVSNTNQCADSGISMSHPNTASTLEEHTHIDHNMNSNSLHQDQTNLSTHSVSGVTGHNSVSPGQTMQYSGQGINIQPIMNTSQPQVMQQQAQSLSSVQNQHPLMGTNQHQSLQPQQMQQVLSATNMHGQQASLQNQQMQQPMQQMQHQGIQMQPMHQQMHQPPNSGNMVPQQQYQQPQIQQMHHQQPPMQTVQQTTQGMIQQQTPMPQHMQQQPVQHQHNLSMPVQQQMNQNQIPMQVPQTVLQNQGQQLPQQTSQMTVHSQMQQNQAQHMQNVAVQQIPMGGVIGTGPQVMQQQNTQQQQYHNIQTSQPLMQQGMQSQPNLIPVQQTQYFTNPQIQGIGVQPIPNTVLQPQGQPNPNIAIQQSYPVGSINQTQQQQIPQQFPSVNTIPQHIPQSQIPTSGVPVMVTSQPVPGIANLSIPATQNSVISPQATSQGPTLVQPQYVTQGIAASVAPTVASGVPQTYASSAVNAVPSGMENVQVYPVDIPVEQSVIPTNQQAESLVENVGVEDAQQLEDAESASGASAVAIDNKIEQAMDLVKSHLMFAVREEVEVLKEKIAELMDRINQLEMENAILKANASPETLAQLASLPPTSSAP
ncbi:protein bunched, class 2/F/G isoform-like isoform X2 [Macrosteles quadrilineatus]|uniref:protein bunched, class 2/F/G isoform-like isoform X2 n=1 Tax=Macrosteles quadrilineatus TaxID=74068 RepID=UPI0023E1542F|nr:protein bunched, class 2/F/G isoform-like isoform X2 [Macrosteles quadrilineatus]